ncbi:MAG: fused MFS/spermidine synthase, partial [Bacteroidales bacterium]|nr:fused MFS/spermidine synthase [Bacteroidales bacterium]
MFKSKFATFLLFTVFLSGFCFLVFEINLYRAISNLLGSTVTASTLVLSVFMGGYGFGALFLGKKANKSSNLQRFFSILIIVTSLGGFLSYFSINHLFSDIYEHLYTIGAGKTVTNIIVYFIVVLCLFIPSFLMGGILPVATRILSNTRQEIAVKIGHVYALDTFGSAIGGLLTGFILNRYLGQYQTVIMAALVLIFVGGLLRFFNKQENTISPIKVKDDDIKQIALSKKISIAVLFTTLLFGFVVNGMQVLLIRVFKIYLINAIYSFTLITSLIILGLFIGSWTFKKMSSKKILSVNLLIKIVIITGFLIPAILLILLHLPQWIMFPVGAVFDGNLYRVLGIPILSTLITVLPLAFLSGFSFPFVNSIFATNLSKSSGQIGKVMMFNTIGAVLGPLVTTFVLIYFFGISHSLLILSGIVFISSLFLTYLTKEIKKTKANYIFGVVGFLLITFIISTNKQLYILPPSYATGNKKVIAINEGIEGTYVVGEEVKGNNRILTTHINNSVVMGTSYDAIKAVKMVGHLPFLLGLECKNALVVGFGIGVTTAAIGIHETVENIDCVELVPGLTHVAHFYELINNNIHQDKRLNFIGDDGRHFLKTTINKYDLISSDPTHPILGSGNIYTKEYFELCREHLSPNGMVSQYLPLHKLRLEDLLGIIKTFHSVFPNSSLWLGHYHGILIGSLEPQNIDFQTWSANMATTKEDQLFYNNPFHVAASLIFDADAIAQITEPYRINTDNIAYTDYFSFASLKEENIFENLNFINENRKGMERFFANITDSVLMTRFIKGNLYLTTGLYYMLQNNNQEFSNYLQKARMVNPENEEYPLLIGL